MLDLFRLLENNSTSPLRLAGEVQAQLIRVMKLEKEEYNQYVEALRGVAATKIIKQLAAMYECLSIDRVCRVIPFFNKTELERFLVDISKHRYVKVCYAFEYILFEFCKAC